MTNRYEQMIANADQEIKEANARVRAAHRAKKRVREESLNAALLDLGRAVALRESINLDSEQENLHDTLALLAVLIEGENDEQVHDTASDDMSGAEPDSDGFGDDTEDEEEVSF